MIRRELLRRRVRELAAIRVRLGYQRLTVLLPAGIRDPDARLHPMQRRQNVLFRHLQSILSRFERDCFQP